MIGKTVILAVENGLDEEIINGLRGMREFENEDEWDFFPINHSDLLSAVVEPDVIVLSRRLEGERPNEILKYIKSTFPTAHIVLYTGEESEQSRNYIRLAKKLGLTNIVRGELPGKIPYTLDLALKYPYEFVVDMVDAENEKAEIVPEFVRENIRPEEPKAKKEIKHNERMPIKPQQGFIIASAGAKGGIGKTSVAAGIILALAQKELSVTAVDYDYSRQDLTAFFKVPDFHRIKRNNFDADEIKRSLVRVKESIYLLPAVGKKVPLEFPSADEVKFTLDVLKQTNPIVIVDTPSDINCHHVPIVLQEADMILISMDQTAFSDQDIFDYGSFLLDIGVNPNKVRIVVNRYSRRLRSTKEMIRLFNQGIRGNVEVLTTIPNDWEAYANLSHKGEIPRVKNRKSPWQDIVTEIGNYIDMPQKSTNSRFRLKKEA